MRVLARHAERMPDLMPLEPDTQGMDPRDANLCHAIVDATVRRWITLSYLVHQAGGRDVREMEPRVQAALLAGAAQLLLFDRVPDHAVLSETVEWAKHRVRVGAGGMVNAILRRVIDARGEFIDEWDGGDDALPLSEGGAMTLVGVRLPEDPRARLAVACSLPRRLLDSWQLLGPPVEELARHTLVHPPTVCVVPEGTDLAGDDRFMPHDSPGHAVFIAERRALASALADHPGMWVQDAAATEVVAGLTTEGDEEVVVDLCAGRGTKTRQLLALFPGARVVAAEVDDERLDALRAVFGGNDRVEVVHAESLPQRGDGWAGLVLCDVPCTNSGVLPRRTEARYRVHAEALHRMTETQRAILTTSASLVRPGGRLVYSTCSLEREENQDQAAWGGRALGFEIIRERVTLPAGLPGDAPDGYRDASYAAECRKSG